MHLRDARRWRHASRRPEGKHARIALVAAAMAVAACGGGASNSTSGGVATQEAEPTAGASTGPPPSPIPSGPWSGSIDIGSGVALRVRCTAGTGWTVILDADLNGDMSEFALVQSELPATMHACAYEPEATN